jgi:hypothetical protein
VSYLKHILGLQNIHELIFIEASRRACQYFLSLLADSYQKASESPQILLDMRKSGLLPLSYLARELSQLRADYPKHPAAHLALVIANPEHLKMSRSILACPLHQDDVQYFTEIESAREWLMQL